MNVKLNRQGTIGGKFYDILMHSNNYMGHNSAYINTRNNQSIMLLDFISFQNE